MTAAKLWALDAPSAAIPAALVLVNAPGEVTIPFPAFLVEHPRGLVLMDTSLHPGAAEDPIGTYPDLAPLLGGLSFAPEQRLDRQLEAIGVAAADITDVVLSHAHFDHLGGLQLFENARFHIGEGELRYAHWPDPPGDPFYRREELERLRDLDLHEVHGDLDLFADGSLVLLATPGHTPGHQSLLVRLGGRSVLLAGDATHLRAGLSGLAFPGDWDTREMRRSIRRISQLAAAEQALLWISHDPQDWADRLRAPEAYV